MKRMRIDPRTWTPHWSGNAQIIRIEAPPAEDAEHHAKMLAFDADFRRILRKHGMNERATYLGFYRANRDFDDVENLNRCVAYPHRGTNSGGLDNEP